MKFITHNMNPQLHQAGVGLSSYIFCTYNMLKRVFGEPRLLESIDYKVTTVWVLQWEDGKKTTIYDYKSSKDYLGPSGCDKEDLIEWHIGGDHAEHIEMMIYAKLTPEQLIVVERIMSCMSYAEKCAYVEQLRELFNKGKQNVVL